MIIEVTYTNKNGLPDISNDLVWNKIGDLKHLWGSDAFALYDYSFFINKTKIYEAKRETPLNIVRNDLEIICLNLTRKEKLSIISSIN
jgi:hypothetical protein